MVTPYAEVIGDPVGHSLSPDIHRFWLGKLGLEGDFRRTRVTADGLAAFLAERRGDLVWRGCNVTMPLKQAVMPLLDSIEDAGVGAVNCIIPADGRLTGYNTDVDGVRECLAAAVSHPHAAHFELAGTGGAARAVLAALRGANATVYGRDESKAEALASAFGFGPRSGASAPLSSLMEPRLENDANPAEWKPDLGAARRHDYVVINATSLGMMGQPDLPIRLDRYPDNTVVIDLVYNPRETPLLREARRRGLVTVDGLTMLIGQAATAFAMFFGTAAPRQHDGELREVLAS